ncbi:hypothetical protein GCM10027199_37830 [Amycolatopsis magusensis]
MYPTFREPSPTFRGFLERLRPPWCLEPRQGGESHTRAGHLNVGFGRLNVRLGCPSVGFGFRNVGFGCLSV